MARQAGEGGAPAPGGIGDSGFLQVLAEALVLTGIAMSISGDSRPRLGFLPRDQTTPSTCSSPNVLPPTANSADWRGLRDVPLLRSHEESAYTAEVLRRHGLPVLPEEIGFTVDEFRPRRGVSLRRPAPAATPSSNT